MGICAQWGDTTVPHLQVVRNQEFTSSGDKASKWQYEDAQASLLYLSSVPRSSFVAFFQETVPTLRLERLAFLPAL